MRIFIADALPVTHGRFRVKPSPSKDSIIVGRAYDAAAAVNGVERVKLDMLTLNPRITGSGELVVFMADASPEARGALLEAGADFCPDEVADYDYEYD